MSITLGPFQIESRVAMGGMGEIWHGRHTQQGVGVALKVLTGARARNEAHYEAFWHEVQNQARLGHPGIILVFDYGTLPAGVDDLSDGLLVPGSPFLVMEWASGGNIRQRTGTWQWGKVRDLLHSLLNALAHAHARGVVHRDIKPENVLLCTADDPRPGAKLTDFGIAHAAASQAPTLQMAPSSDLLEAPSGTPSYMAPEQFRGRWRDYGPWTDLYALGVLTYEMVCGHKPYPSGEFWDMAALHLGHSFPALEPVIETPAGLETWLARLVAKDPRKRFARAADAAAALADMDRGWRSPPGDDDAASTLPATVGVTLDADSDPLRREYTTQLEGRTVQYNDALLEQAEGAERPPTDEVLIPFLVREVPPLPETWHGGEERLPLPLLGAGLGLYGLREVPLVGRTQERDVLWRELGRVREEGRARAVVLRGASGTGKGRLARWLCERADEVGSAVVLRATHQPGGGPSHGLPRLLSEHYRCVGLDTADASIRLGQTLRREGVKDEYEWRALSELMAVSSGSGTITGERIVRFSSPRERYVLVHRVLERVCARRPAVLWLDDVQWGIDSLSFVEFLLEAQDTRPLPVLLLLTARDDALSSRKFEAGILTQILQADRVLDLRVPPLPPEDAQTLVRNLLHLRGDLAKTVAERMDGNPLFAVRLVGDWVQRGVLEMTGTGFALKKGEVVSLPDSLHEIWAAHVDRLLEGTPQSARVALELAAIFGQDVAEVELRAGCQRAGVALPPPVLEGLLAAGFLRPRADGWAFEHALLRESLARSANDAGRAEHLHRTCAQTLTGLYAPGTLGVAPRRARHLLAAGDVEGAVLPMMEAVVEKRETSDYLEGLELLDEYDAIQDALGTSADDPRRLRGLLLRAEMHRYRWEFHEGVELVDEVLARTPTGALRALALLERGNLARQQGEMQLAREHLAAAEPIFAREADVHGHARAVLATAILHREQGALPQARALYTRAQSLFSNVRDDHRAAQCLLGLGNVCRQAQQLDEAREHYVRAGAGFEATGNRNELANAINGVAEVDRYQGDLEAAERGYRRAVEIFDAVGSQQATLVRLNLGLVLVNRGMWAQAQAAFGHVLRSTRQTRFQAIAHACLLPCAAFSGDEEGWEAHIEPAERLLAETKLVDPDLAQLAETAASLWSDAGRTVLAQRCLRLALAQWQGLGNAQRAANVAARLL